jgi:hypothetical protein
VTTLYTAICAAIAASFSALSSFLLMLIHWQNLLETVRPELVLVEWTRSIGREEDATRDVISFRTIKNVGRGPALNVFLNASNAVRDPAKAMVTTKRLPILAASEANDLNGEIKLWWKNVVPGKDQIKLIPISIIIHCWDSRGMRHETRYNLMASESTQMLNPVDEIAPGVFLLSRTTSARPLRWLKFLRSMRRIPLLGRLFRSPEDGS